MKFGRNQPRSQPIVRVVRLDAIPMCRPSNPHLTRPAFAQLHGAPRASSQEGTTTMNVIFLPPISMEACEGGMPEVLSSR
jgi:hypothetical protein